MPTARPTTATRAGTPPPPPPPPAQPGTKLGSELEEFFIEPGPVDVLRIRRHAGETVTGFDLTDQAAVVGVTEGADSSYLLTIRLSEAAELRALPSTADQTKREAIARELRRAGVSVKRSGPLAAVLLDIAKGTNQPTTTLTKD